MADIRFFVGRVLNQLFSLLPTKKKVVFVNFAGQGYGDSPKYIAEEIINQLLPYDLVWLVYNMNAKLPSRIRKVKFYSFRSRYELATARIIISNTKSRLPYIKKKSQYYIQTWHGGFGVKYIEKEIENSLSPKYVRDSMYDSSITDLILSGSEFQTKVIKDAFWYDGEIFKRGVPRNDIFFNLSTDLIYRIKLKLGFETSDKIVTYAPTFRDDFCTDAYRLDALNLLDTLKKKTGCQWKLIIRLHPIISGQSSIFNYNDNVINGSDFEDAQEVLLITDILITDFSSMMMDSAIMKRPVFLFITDLEDYIKKCRGIRPLFYQLPFDLAHSNEELYQIIQKFDIKDYHERLKTFMKKNYVSYDDGHASEYVVERIKKYM